jgi:alpha-1,2-mannosyltransferase
VWAIRVRKAIAVGDERTGFALTGVVGCLISPITWVHHLVWLIPAVLLFFDRAVAATSREQRRWLWGFTIFSYAVLSSRLVWVFHEIWSTNPILWFFSNFYVWISLALLISLPIATPEPAAAEPKAESADSGDFDRAMAGLLQSERAPVGTAAPAPGPPGESVAPPS